MLRIILFLTVSVPLAVFGDGPCGCKALRKCYVDMLNTLRDKDEEVCVENVVMGANTLMIYLNALQQFCSDIITIKHTHSTYEKRPLYEVIISRVIKGSNATEEALKPVIFVDAGQIGGSEPVRMILVFIQQLAACTEYTDMITRVKWVLLPCVNLDGMVYGVYNRIEWRKNLKPSADFLGFGVDLSRNFDYNWGQCNSGHNVYSLCYPGTAAFSEKESQYVRDLLNKHKSNIRAYVSLRRNGHSLLYPYASSNDKMDNEIKVKKFAYEVTNKINQRAGVVQMFINESIYNMNGHFRCGHSVDYAYALGIPFCYEMRVFLGTETEVMTLFQVLPKGYLNSLLMGYISGLKRLYELIVADHDYPIKKPSLF